MNGKPLFIPLKRAFFEAFERGDKTNEYRPYGPRWNERTCIVGRRVLLSLGYGKGKRRTGRIVALTKHDLPGFLPGWEKCYGTRHACAAVITIEVDRQ